MATNKTTRKAAVTVQDVKPKRDPFYSNPDSLNEFCEYIAAGGNLTQFARERGMSYTPLADWIHDIPAHKERYERARELRADVIFDEIVAISDEKDVKARYNEDEVTLELDSTAVARNRLRVDARKWAAAKLRPRVYGDKTTTELTGANGGAIQLAAVSFKGLSDAELEQMQTLLSKAAK